MSGPSSRRWSSRTASMAACGPPDWPHLRAQSGWITGVVFNGRAAVSTRRRPSQLLWDHADAPVSVWRVKSVRASSQLAGQAPLISALRRPILERCRALIEHIQGIQVTERAEACSPQSDFSRHRSGERPTYARGSADSRFARLCACHADHANDKTPATFEIAIGVCLIRLRLMGHSY